MLQVVYAGGFIKAKAAFVSVFITKVILSDFMAVIFVTPKAAKCLM